MSWRWSFTIGSEIPVSATMIKRYVDLETWEQIASEMDMTVRAVQSLHGYGLVEMEAQLGDEE